MSTPADLPYWVALSRCYKLGPTRFALLRRAFPTMAEAWAAGQGRLLAAGLEPTVVQALTAHRAATNVEQSWQEVERLGLGVVTIADDNYPALLKTIYDPPALLYYHGSLACLARPCLAVVGTRQATDYGKRAGHELTLALARAGLTIVSGLAYGIDAVAHRAALEAGAATVSVEASGLDEVYPTAHRQLAEQIVASGGLRLSELPPRTAPLKQNFPFRNRIIAGLTRGTLVIEAGADSGALLTAKLALESNREVFTVPSSIFSPVSQGTNELLKLGAHPVAKAQDVLEVFGLTATALTAPRPALNPAATALLELVGLEPKGIDELVRLSGKPAAELIAQLTMLEVAGHVREGEGGRYTRAM